MGKLTATGVRAALSKPGRHMDGDGLFLVVGARGSASWVVRVQKGGRRRDFGLGSARKVGLSLARTRAAEVRSQVEAGLDPVVQRRKAAGIPTFRQAAALVHAEHKKTWRNGKHQAQWLRTLEVYAFPAIGDRLVSEIDGPTVRDLLGEIWLDKPETARRVRQRVGAVLDWAFSKGHRSEEAPMRSLSKGLPRQPKRAGHLAAMPFTDVPAFMTRLREKETFGRMALEAAILTAARSGEIRGATWSEVDLEKALWTVPAKRMKAGREHVVPLSPAAKRVFQRAAALRTEGSPFVFPGSRRNKGMSDNTLVKVLRDMDETVTAHGFRSSFRDWVSEETTFQGELAEAALAHTIENKVEAAYRRGNLLEKRRKLMDAWSSYCGNAGAKVIRIADHQ
ncbi:tyrosine-type recombinase/integrase [Sphingomonas sp. RB56-2]|uniref:Tyrosine-type recombinase/integrase n=1 Tax=Sphingomonas brevis TaxID=2908206 RepID=A0ABT0SBG7_9SPHN|nr:site-specific integrase [Sphingomonas brevis]MCL6741765.1 tyrosine-type recombinase/integrase [Sphingomonas brevis]